MRQSKNTQIKELKEQLADLDDKYNEAHHAEVTVAMYKKKLADFNTNQSAMKQLEQDNKQLRNQTDFLISQQSKMQEMEKGIEFFK